MPKRESEKQFDELMKQNRHINNEILAKAGWICASVDVEAGREILMARKEFLVSEYYFPFLPRAGDIIGLTTFSKEAVLEYGPESEYTDSIQAKVIEVEIESISSAAPLIQVSQAIESLCVFLKVILLPS
ncbi:hypothetical protein [Kamptonema formosum]|uniref:hypothetical protein n=1 Tax=Kamptonema formosum TaxID=331992 RepID=UPI00034D1602|nr:hypothetical protein [Oscillatoria sp. PCC 10802]